MMNSIVITWFYDSDQTHIATVDTAAGLDGKAIRMVFYADKQAMAFEDLIHFLKKHAVSFEQQKNCDEFEAVIHENDFETHVLFENTDRIEELQTTEHEYVFDKFSTLSDADKETPSKQENEILPIPDHLKEILVPFKNGNSQLSVSGSLCCACGNHEFTVKTFAESGEDAGADGSYVSVTCAHCHREYVIFDSHMHGWNGFVCGYLGEREQEHRLQEFACNRCTSTVFKVDIHISSQGQEDFIRELKTEIHEGKFSKEDWVNAFCGIKIVLSCMHCNQKYPEFAEYDTM